MNKDVFFCELGLEEKLYYKHIFFEDMQPIFFVCNNDVEKLFICVLCDDRDGCRWIVSPTSKKCIMNMIFNKITIRDMFESSKYIGKSYVITQKNGVWFNKKVTFNEIEKEDLPTEGEYFDADIDEKKNCFEAIWNEEISDGYRREAVGEQDKIDSLRRYYLERSREVIEIKKNIMQLRRSAVL